ncbi:MAG: hypothetical protein PHU40_10375 [Sulfurimonas sp.]|nr:hypothetical protein [Sulfurimonas sp.]
MDLTKLEFDITSANAVKTKPLADKVIDAFKITTDASKVELGALDIEMIKTVATTLVEIETRALHDELEVLLAQKEQLERKIEKQSDALQEAKYTVFNAIEAELIDQDQALSKLHQIKLQSIDLFDFLGELVESAIITALEKDTDGDIKETTQEVIKDITFEAIKEGSLNTIRIRKILSTILQSAIEVAEATPNRANEILPSTLKGMRSGLFKAIDRFKKRLAYMPVEAKHILIEDYDTIIEDLNQTDTLFSQVILTQASQYSQNSRVLLLETNKNMRFDLDELVHLSKETADVMKDRFSIFAKKAVKSADSALKSQKAQEAKRMGVQALGVAKTALHSAIKSAKDAMEKREK